MEVLYEDSKAPELIYRALINGECFLSPTDTIYGLGCDGLNPKAVDKIRSLKGRSAEKPFILLASGVEFVESHFHCADIATELKALWPGPFSVLLRPKTKSLESIAPDSGKIAVRIPKDTLLQTVFNIWDGFILSTSANLSGDPYIHDWEKIKEKFSGKLDLWVKKPSYIPCKPSSLLDVENGNWKLLREGEIRPPFPFEFPSGKKNVF